MQDNQLAIRIQLKKKPTETNAALEILWDRVIAVGLAAILMVGLAVWLLWRAIPGPDANDIAGGATQVAPASAALETPKPEVRPLAPVEHRVASVSGNRRSANDDAGQAPTAVTEPAPKPDEAIEKGAVSDPAEAAAPTAISDVATSEAVTTETTTTETLTSERARHEATPAPEQLAAPAAADLQASGAFAKVDIRSDHVARAVISQTREGRAPGVPLGEVVAMDGRDLITLYMFTHYQNLRGQWVFHDWYRNGKRQARVRARPHLAEMDIYSSKFIDTHMLGDWQVKVRTAAGTLLAETSFKVVP